MSESTLFRAARDYARRKGANLDEADEVAHGVEAACRRITRHVVTQAGFTPDRFNDTERDR